MIAVNEFKERRRKLLEKMEDFSVAVIFAGASKIQSEDETCPYLANRNFYYLTNNIFGIILFLFVSLLSLLISSSSNGFLPIKRSYIQI